MSWYFWWQQTGGDEVWHLELADQRERLVRDKLPQFVTILDADNDCKDRDNMGFAEWAKVSYRGPLYFDFDAPTIEEATTQFKKFLNKLKDEHSFELEQAYLYASGGKGYHLIIPSECFISKPNPRGYYNLPLIFKEMAHELYVDTLDLRVYSAKMGRQFRVENVLRTNGKYKVPITVDEALNMDNNTYYELVSAPRHVKAPISPTLNSGLALLFASATDNVGKRIKARLKNTGNKDVAAQFKGQTPETVKALMAGERIASGVGFNKIAMQLAIFASTMSIERDIFLDMCAGLIENHKGDGNRYNTPGKRKFELTKMWNYMYGNHSFEFSIGGIKSLVEEGEKTPDLDGDDIVGDAADQPTSEELDTSLTQGMKVSTKGIFRRSEEGWMKVSAIGLSNPSQLRDYKTNKVVGYEVEVYVDGEFHRKEVLDMSAFLSRAKFMQFTLSTGGSSLAASETQVGALADIMRSRAERTKSKVFTTSREGLDVIVHLNGDVDVVWADQFEVQSRLGYQYRLTGSLTAESQFRTDLMKAAPLSDSEQTREYFRHFFRINSLEVLAKIFGFNLSCFFTQIIRHLYDQFPSMQVFGPAGSGKTATNRLLAALHYNRMRPRTQSMMSLTNFAAETLVSCSASIPILFDEFKPREMRRDRLDKAKEIIRTNYNAESLTRGNIDKAAAESRPDLKTAYNTSPLIFLGEAIESQAAILDRCVMVPMNKEGKGGHAEDYDYCYAHRDILSAFGRLCVDEALKVSLAGVHKSFDEKKKEVRDLLGEAGKDADRPVFNMATVLFGLDFGAYVLRSVFGDVFDENMKELRQALVSRVESMIPRVVSEASQVLDTFAYLSRNESDDKMRLAYGQDYVVYPDRVEIKVRNAFAKYQRYKRSVGEEVLYDNEQAFLYAMKMYEGRMRIDTLESPLKGSAGDIVYAFELEFLTKSGVGTFKLD